MADTLAVLASRLADLERLVRDLSRSSRLANSSIENGAITVYDDGGDLRGSIGLQSDGTLAIKAVNGPPPPAPSAPQITSVLGGVAVTWDGSFADGSQAPADFAGVAVYFSATEDFPDGGTLFSAFYSPAGASMTVPAAVPVWARLVCVSTSGAVSDPSAVAGPAGPLPVVAQSVLDGIVGELGLADDAVTRAKIAAGAVGKVEIADDSITTPKLVAGSINGDRLAVGTVAAEALVAASITAAQIRALSLTGDRLAVNTITADRLAVGTITAASGVISSIDASKITTGTLDASKAAITNLNASSITAGTITVDRLSVGLQGQVGQKWYDFGDSAPRWTAPGGGTVTTVSVPDAQSGGSVMRCVGFISGATRSDVKIPFDPSVTYRVSIRARQTVANSTPGTNQKLFAGVAGLAADGVTPVNLVGANSFNSQFYVAVNGADLTVGGGWVTYTGYLKGTSSSPVGGAKPNPNAPGQLHASARYITPIFFVNHNGGSGTAEIDMMAIEVVESGAIKAANIIAGAIDGQTITGGVVRTAASGARLVMDPAGGPGSTGALLIYSGHASELTPGQISSAVLDLGGGNLQPQTVIEAPYISRGNAALSMRSPVQGIAGGLVRVEASDNLDGTAYSFWEAARDTNDTSRAVTYASNGFGGGGGFTNVEVRGSGFHIDASTKNLDFSESGGLVVDTGAQVAGVFTAGNMAFGSVNIVPSAANTPTSVMVSGLNVRGSTFRAYVTANTSVPGTTMLGVGATSASSTGLTVWLTRSNTSSTTVYWMVIGS
ncbi:hypothetical protein PV342_12590 [Streptomyces sp. PA03-3a]|nr:hypothetical protein [Streptomyces sp. PA03-3a]